LLNGEKFIILHLDGCLQIGLINIQQKTTMAIRLSYSDFRIREYDGDFEIQRKKVTTETSGHLWWKKIKTNVEWRNVDNFGNFIYSYHGPYGYIKISNTENKIDSFKNIKTAMDKIDLFVKGPTYHDPAFLKNINTLIFRDMNHF